MAGIELGRWRQVGDHHSMWRVEQDLPLCFVCGGTAEGSVSQGELDLLQVSLAPSADCGRDSLVVDHAPDGGGGVTAEKW